MREEVNSDTDTITGEYLKSIFRLDEIEMMFLLANNSEGISEPSLIEENLNRYFLGVYLRSKNDPTIPISFNLSAHHNNIQFLLKDNPKIFLSIFQDLEKSLLSYSNTLNFRGEHFERIESIFLVSEILNMAQLKTSGVSKKNYHFLRELAFKILFPDNYKSVLSDFEETFNIKDISELDGVVQKYSGLVEKIVKDFPIKITISGRARNPAGAYSHMLQKNTLMKDIDDNISIELTLDDTTYDMDGELCRKYGDEVANRASEMGLIFEGRDDFRIVKTPHGYSGVHYYFKNSNGLSIELKWNNEHAKPQTMTKSEYSNWQRSHFMTGSGFNLFEEVRLARESSVGLQEIAIKCFYISLREFQSKQTIILISDSDFKISFEEDTLLIGVDSPELKESLERSFLPYLTKNINLLGSESKWQFYEA